jgi:hypothetical protein
MDTRSKRGRGLLVLVACGCLAGIAAASGLPGQLPLRKDPEPVDAGTWLPALVLLALLVAAGGLAVWHRGGAALAAAMKRTLRSEHRPGPARVSSVALTPQASIHVVHWQGEELLLGCTAQQVTLLARKPGAATLGDPP